MNVVPAAGENPLAISPIQSDINCSVDLQSTAAVGDRRYSRMREYLYRSV